MDGAGKALLLLILLALCVVIGKLDRILRAIRERHGRLR